MALVCVLYEVALLIIKFVSCFALGKKDQPRVHFLFFFVTEKKLLLICVSFSPRIFWSHAKYRRACLHP
jgi:hypothetical protein